MGPSMGLGFEWSRFAQGPRGKRSSCWNSCQRSATPRLPSLGPCRRPPEPTTNRHLLVHACCHEWRSVHAAWTHKCWIVQCTPRSRRRASRSEGDGDVRQDDHFGCRDLCAQQPNSQQRAAGSEAAGQYEGGQGGAPKVMISSGRRVRPSFASSRAWPTHT